MDEDVMIITCVEELAAKKAVSMAQITIAWELTKVDSPIIGMGSVCLPAF